MMKMEATSLIIPFPTVKSIFNTASPLKRRWQGRLRVPGEGGAGRRHAPRWAEGAGGGGPQGRPQTTAGGLRGPDLDPRRLLRGAFPWGRDPQAAAGPPPPLSPALRPPHPPGPPRRIREVRPLSGATRAPAPVEAGVPAGIDGCQGDSGDAPCLATQSRGAVAGVIQRLDVFITIHGDHREMTRLTLHAVG